MLADTQRPSAKPVMSKDGRYVFMPLDGDGNFGVWSLATMEYVDEQLTINVQRPLTQKEVCRLCDAAAHYMFYSLLISIPKGQGSSGALRMCIPYDDDIPHQRDFYPHELKQKGGPSGTGGARV